MVKMPFENNKKPTTVDVNKLINRGAPVKEDFKNEESKKWMFINLRLPASLMEEVDNALGDMVGISRNGWILQTIQKELKRLSDSKENTKD